MQVTQVAYYSVRPRSPHDVARTVEVGPSGQMLVDVDEQGRILGIETLDGGVPDWYALVEDEQFRFVGDAS